VKTLQNAVGLLVSIMEAAASDYEMLDSNPLRGMLRRKQFPHDAHHLRGRRVRVLEPVVFRRALQELRQPVLDAVLVAALTGLRWGEQMAVRIDEEVDFTRNKLHITRALYRRVAQTPKTAHSVRDIDLCPTVRRIFQAVVRTRQTGLVFSLDGTTPIGDGTYIKRQWRQAQLRSGIHSPIAWHDLRHQFVSLLIASGKHPKYIAMQAGHASAGFTMDRYGSLFDTLPITPVEWWDDLLWPAGSPVAETLDAIHARPRSRSHVCRLTAVHPSIGIERWPTLICHHFATIIGNNRQF
jgi:integrase